MIFYRSITFSQALYEVYDVHYLSNNKTYDIVHVKSYVYLQVASDIYD